MVSWEYHPAPHSYREVRDSRKKVLGFDYKCELETNSLPLVVLKRFFSDFTFGMKIDDLGKYKRYISLHNSQ